MTIHPTAFIDPAARIGGNVAVGPYTIVHPNVVIGDDSVIGSHCEIGHPSPRADGSPLITGERALIRSHSIFYEGSSFGTELTTGHRVTVREGTHAGINARLGTLAEIMGEVTIGDYFRMLNNSHIAQFNRIGNFVWVFAYVFFANDRTPPSNDLYGSTVEDFAVIASKAAVLPGVTIGEHALVGAMTLVSKDVPARTIASGNPMQLRGPTSRIRLRKGDDPAYPWTDHFSRGYPQEIVEGWARAVETLPTDDAVEPPTPA
ncbi:MAG: N-acetyltransferase [Sphingobium sp.]|nr:N-acetyltransferase [Sphingobium sp.]